MAGGGPAGNDSAMEDLTGVMWNDKVWLSYFPLNSNTALSYFAQSQFYDRSCNNELIKMQRLDPALLATMEGIEYDLTHSVEPSLFVIAKRRRKVNPPATEHLATYYIVDGNVYQAPTAYAVLSSRVLQSLHHLKSTFEEMQSHAKLDSTGEYKWVPPPPAFAQTEPVWESSSGSLSAERKLVNGLLYGSLEKNRRMAAAKAPPGEQSQQMQGVQRPAQ